MRRSFFFLTTGFALFAMFFGAGNLAFPLLLGREHHESSLVAAIGFSTTAVLAPLIGFWAMMLYRGNYRDFFAPLGKFPGLIMTTLVLLLLGPCGAIPRCIAFSFSACRMFFPDLSLAIFSLIACVVIFLLSFRENVVITLLGKVLTPLMLCLLALILLTGFSQNGPVSDQPITEGSFWQGLLHGPQTLDLFAALLFSAYLYPCLQGFIDNEKTTLLKASWKVSLVAGILLFAVYAGFCFIAASHNEALLETPIELLLIAISEHLLGPYGAACTVLLIILACLTTVLALAAIFAEFLKNELLTNRINYEMSLAITVLIAFFFALLNFHGIVVFLAPILMVLYPALIVLCLGNIASKLWNFKRQEILFFVTLAATLLYKGIF